MAIFNPGDRVWAPRDLTFPGWVEVGVLQHASGEFATVDLRANGEQDAVTVTVPTKYIRPYRDAGQQQKHPMPWRAL